MAITPRPKPPDSAPVKSDVDVDALINRGGSVAARSHATTGAGRPAKADGDDVMLVQLRLSPALVKQIDAAVKGRSVKIPRHTWLLEAVAEKLKRESEMSK
jgi:hypothetical protein